MNEALFFETNPGPVKYVLGLMGKITRNAAAARAAVRCE